MAKRLPQIGFLPGEETSPQLSFGGNPEPVATRAKMAAYRTDDPDLAKSALIPEMESRAVAFAVIRPLKRRDSLKPLENLSGRNKFLVIPALLKRHEFDEPDMKRILECQAGEIFNFIVVYLRGGRRC